MRIPLKDYTAYRNGKWVEVCHCYLEKPGSDEQVKVVAKFLDPKHAIDYAKSLCLTIVGPDQIIVR